MDVALRTNPFIMATLGVFFFVVLISLAIVRERAILLNLTKPYRTFDLQFSWHRQFSEQRTINVTPIYKR